MRKSIVSVVLLLGAGVALGAVSQRMLLTRAEVGLECAVGRCASKSPSTPDPAIGIVAPSARTRMDADGTVDGTLLASKPIPGWPTPEPSPSAWITPFNVSEAVAITPLGQDVVVKTLTLPAGQYMVLGTLDTTTNISGFCVLQGKAASAPFFNELDTASVGGREMPGWSPSNEIQVRVRVSLQGAVAFDGSGGDVRVVCRSFFDSAHAPLQMEVQRPVLSAQLQRAIVLAPP